MVLVPQVDGGFTVAVPELPDVVTEGETIEQAIAAANRDARREHGVLADDAIEGYIETLSAHGWSVPRAQRARVVVEVPAP